MEIQLVEDLIKVSLSMFRKDFIGIFHGSLSAKIEEDRFIINKKEAIFDELTPADFIELNNARDYRWKDASIDALIHYHIYQNISEAKYIAYTMPPFVTAYTLEHETITPKDYFGARELGKIDIYDPGRYETWYDRAKIEIYQKMMASESSLLVIKGYGIYAYDRDLKNLVKTVALLENSCKILHRNAQYRGRGHYPIS
ncbi:MAG: hypothetical protein B6D59_04320 [Campylobacteraceae bacterium 4484_4]|nr:MAG: hypothetical protein B6D59_04320 [Campylobacteraceae bacterium 4484_4]